MLICRVKFTVLLLFLLIGSFLNSFAQWGSDGLYLWNTTGITCKLNDKTELFFGNKDHYNTQINRLDYMHFELIGYRKLSSRFSLGMGLRQTENFKSEQWTPGQTYLFYGIVFFSPLDIKIKFANRLTAKVSKTADTQYGLDNITNIDFFTRSANKFPKPYLMDELFSTFNAGKIQTVRMFGGFHVIAKEHWGIDLFYCSWQTRLTDHWKYFNVLGLGTKFKI